MENKPSKRLNQYQKGDKQGKFYGKTMMEGERSICLNCRLEGGLHRAFGYSYISEFRFDPSEGIEILTTSTIINIKGRNLQKLYADLLRHKVTWIQGFEDEFNDETLESDLFIRKIEIEEEN